MIRFAWRQFRFPAVSIAALLVAVAVVFLITGPHLADLYTQLKHCTTQSDCAFLSTTIMSQDSKIADFTTAISLVLPAVLGIFWGAPLIARELETGTYRLAWTQGVTRSKWIVCKNVVVGVASMLAAGLMAWMLTWWASPIDAVNANRFGTQVFDTRYIAPIAYAAFAFAVGVSAGVLWRRTLPAMASTLVVYVTTRTLFTQYLRPHLLSPKRVVGNISQGGAYGFQQTPSGLQFLVGSPSRPNALVFNSYMVGKHGAGVTSQWLATNCPKLLLHGPQPSGNTSVGIKSKKSIPDAFDECVHTIAHHFHEVLVFQPAGRFWTFQWIEGGIYLAVALALCAFSYWWLRRRVT